LVKEISNAKVIAVDTPGRGESEKLVNPMLYNLQTYAVIAMNILTYLGNPEEVEWIGVSMGGLLGMVLSAASINCPIKRLALIDIGPFISKAAVERIGSYVGKDPSYADVGEAEKYFRSVYTQMGPLTDEQWTHMTSYLTKPKEDGTIGLHYDPAIALAFKGQEPKEIDLWAFWGLISSTRILVMHGALSDVLSLETVQRMQAEGPKVEKLVTFDNCGHTPHLFSEETCRELINWLK
jgi:pimeloyl-ACP methyl ester carboxylesterase